MRKMTKISHVIKPFSVRFGVGALALLMVLQFSGGFLLPETASAATRSDMEKPTANFTSPDQGSLVDVENPLHVTGEYQEHGSSSIRIINLYISKGEKYDYNDHSSRVRAHLEKDGSEGTFSYTWNPSVFDSLDITGGDTFTVTAVPIDHAGNGTRTRETLTLHASTSGTSTGATSKPLIHTTFPSLVTGNSPMMTIRATAPESGLDKVQYHVYKAGTPGYNSGHGSIIPWTTVSLTDGEYEHTVDLSGVPNGDYVLDTRAFNNAGQKRNDVIHFTLDRSGGQSGEGEMTLEHMNGEMVHSEGNNTYLIGGKVTPTFAINMHSSSLVPSPREGNTGANYKLFAGKSTANASKVTFNSKRSTLWMVKDSDGLWKSQYWDGVINTNNMKLGGNNGTTTGSGTYTLLAKAKDKAGDTAKAKYTIIVDNTAPTISVKDGYDGNKSDKTFSRVSFKLHDKNGVDKYDINGHEVDFTNNQWSDANFQNIKPFLREGENTLTLYDVLGNTATYTFTYNPAGNGSGGELGAPSAPLDVYISQNGTRLVGGETVKATTTPILHWSTPVEGPVDHYEFWMTYGNGNDQAQIGSTHRPSSSGVGSVSVFPEKGDGTYTYHIKAVNASGSSPVISRSIFYNGEEVTPTEPGENLEQSIQELLGRITQLLNQLQNFDWNESPWWQR